MGLAQVLQYQSVFVLRARERERATKGEKRGLEGEESAKVLSLRRERETTEELRHAKQILGGVYFTERK